MGELWGIRRMSYSSTPKVTVLPSTGAVGTSANRRLYFVLAGAAAAALLAGVAFKLWQTRQASFADTSQDPGQGLVIAEESGVADLETAATADFASPFVAASPSLALADPTLLQSTPPQTRIPTVAAGRPDPFAPLVTPSLTPNRQATAQRLPAPPPPIPTALPVASAPASLPALPTAQPLPTVPVVATQGLPALPPVTIPNLSVPMVPGGLPLLGGSNSTAMLPSPGALSVIDQVTVSGVVQIGQQVHAIVNEPGSSAGRRVAQGDAVAAGQVRVKAIDLSGPDPTVVLTYNGRDYYRTVGGSGSF